MKNIDPYTEWLEAAAKAEDGYATAGISVGTLVLIILLVILIF